MDGRIDDQIEGQTENKFNTRIEAHKETGLN